MNLKSILAIFFTGVLLASCSTSSDLTGNSLIKKRRYTKGFYVDFKKNHTYTKQEAVAVTPSVNRDLAKPESHYIQDFEPIFSSKTEMYALVETEPRNFDNSNLQVANDQAAPFRLPHEEYETYRRVKGEQEDALNRYDEWNRAAVATSEPQLLYYILAIVIPPLAVGLLYGITIEFWISLILTLLFWLPGAIYSLVMTLKHFGEI